MWDKSEFLIFTLIYTQVYLNTSFCLVLRNTLSPVHQINHQINLIFTTPYASLARASKPIPSPHLVPPPRFHFFQSHPISHTMSQLTTRATYISSIYGVRMLPQHSKPARIHTVPSPRSFRGITTIRKHHHFGEILKYFFLMFFKTV